VVRCGDVQRRARQRMVHGFRRNTPQYSARRDNITDATHPSGVNEAYLYRGLEGCVVNFENGNK